MNRNLRLLIVILVIALLFAGGVVAMRKLGESEASRRAKLIEEAREALDELRAELAAEGIETFVGSTLRTATEQAGKVAVGSSTTSQSWHLLGRAVDLYPIDPDTGQADMNGKLWSTLFRRMHELAPRFGWRGLAFNADGSRRYLKRSDGSTFWDGGHLEFPGGMTWAAASAKYKASGGLA